MSTAVLGVNTVGKAEIRLGIAVVVLQRYFNYGGVYLLVYRYRQFMDGNAVMVQMPHKTSNTAFKVIGLLSLGATVNDGYLQTFVEVGYFPYPFGKDFIIIR